MADINSVVLSGRLTDEPKLHYVQRNTDESVAVCRFVLATEDTYGRTSFIPVIIWRHYAEAVANYVSKGQEVIVVGKIQSRQDKEKTRTFIEIHAQEVKFGAKSGGK